MFITYVTNRGKARTMFHIGTGHSNDNVIFPIAEFWLSSTGEGAPPEAVPPLKTFAPL